MASEKPAEKPAAAPAAEEGKDAPRKKGGMKMIVAAVAVVLLEIGTVFVTAKMAGGPRHVEAAPPASAPAEHVEKDAEVKLINAKLPNSKSGRLYLYTLEVFVKVSEKDKEHVTELITERESEIKDQVRAIIASADPQTLAEPGLETLRRQIVYQLEHALGKDLIKELLIPNCTPYRAE
jgi:flagellar basal body-associated protein FliL